MLVSYFNDRYDFYGRELRVETFAATSSAAADADEAARTPAFAAALVSDPAYLGPLVDRGVVAVLGGFLEPTDDLASSRFAWGAGSPEVQDPLATETIAYEAFKSMAPSEEPSAYVIDVYEGLRVVALGVQAAGPILTPESFRDGLYGLPAATGPLGIQSFGPGDHLAYAPTAN